MTHLLCKCEFCQVAGLIRMLIITLRWIAFLFLCRWKWCEFFKRQSPPPFFNLWICNMQTNLKWLGVEPHALKNSTENWFLWACFWFCLSWTSEVISSFDTLVEHVPWQPMGYLSHPELHLTLGRKTQIPESPSVIFHCRWRWLPPDSWDGDSEWPTRQRIFSEELHKNPCDPQNRMRSPQEGLQPGDRV